MTFERPILSTLIERLNEKRTNMHILSGARQIGKTTLILQALDKINQPHWHAIAESGFDTNWIEQQWAIARNLCHDHPTGAILVFDEIQKINNWSERIKRLWDEDTKNKKPLKVVLLGSSSLLLQRGLTESMAGRFEILHISHWSLKECQDAFGVSLDEYLYFGAYPGALEYRLDEQRFLAYMQDSIIEPVVTRDILSQYIIQKPALLRTLFHLGCTYSGQILSYNKMIGQMQDAGNTTTLAHYIQLLDQAGVLKGIHKFANETLRQRQSSPKLQVHNTALMTSANKSNFQTTINDPEHKGRLVESAVGASLLMDHNNKVSYWREDNKEVDFIVQINGKTIAIVVKSGKKQTALPGLDAFKKAHAVDVLLLVGGNGIPLDLFLKTPLTHFI
jgi:predicted AAA+ superfamily ATPase